MLSYKYSFQLLVDQFCMTPGRSCSCNRLVSLCCITASTILLFDDCRNAPNACDAGGSKPSLFHTHKTHYLHIYSLRVKHSGLLSVQNKRKSLGPSVSNRDSSQHEIVVLILAHSHTTKRTR